MTSLVHAHGRGELTLERDNKLGDRAIAWVGVALHHG
jgi:hypothetical protein